MFDNSNIADSLKPVLRVYPNSKQSYINYEDIYYIKVKNHCINPLKVNIRDEKFKNSIKYY